MAKYLWKGKDRFQNRVKGIILADTPQQARQRLYQQGIQVLSLARNWQIFTAFNLAQQAEFLLQFSLLLQAEIPLKSALVLLQQQTQNEKAYQLVSRCLHHLNLGLPLSAALQNEKNFLSTHEWQLLYSGEHSGQLTHVITQLAESKQNQAKLQQQIKKIIIYPAMMLSISFVLTIFLLLFIVPTFADLYAQQQQSLPWLTQLLLTLSQFLQTQLWFLCGGVFLCGLMLYQTYRKFPQLKHYCVRLLCVIPHINRLYCLIQSIRFFSILATMLQAGITLQQSLSSFLPQTKQLKPKIYSHLAKEASQCLSALQQGRRFSEGLSYTFISQSDRQMIIIGENSGRLAQILHYLTEHHQQYLSTQVELFAKLLEPILMLIIGSVIGVIIAGMYLPIFNLGNTIL